jgi:hypothetical protein
MVVKPYLHVYDNDEKRDEELYVVLSESVSTLSTDLSDILQVCAFFYL